MKPSIQSILFACLFLLNACHDTMDITPCLDDKIKDFKKDPSAESIVRIDKLGETLYWFVDVYGDGVEEIFNEKCEVVCITDCECVGTFVQCDETQLGYPMVTIWEK